MSAIVEYRNTQDSGESESCFMLNKSGLNIKSKLESYCLCPEFGIKDLVVTLIVTNDSIVSDLMDLVSFQRATEFEKQEEMLKSQLYFGMNQIETTDIQLNFQASTETEFKLHDYSYNLQLWMLE